MKASILFGALGGLLSGLSFYVLSLFHEDPTNLNLVLGYLITPLTIYLAIKFFKDYKYEGQLSFAEGMSLGAVSFSLLALLSTGIIWGLLESSPSLFSTIQTAKWTVLEKYKELIISQVDWASYDVAQANLKSMTAWDIALNDGIWKILPGIFLTPLFSSILRKSLNEELVKWYQKWWGIVLLYVVFFLIAGLYSNQSKESSSAPISCLAGVDWVYPSASNPTGAWKFSSDGTFNSSTTMFGGMSTWGNWADLGGGRIKITYTRTTENYLPDSQIIELNGCNKLRFGQTIYIKD
jgi:hypothetical protein